MIKAKGSLTGSLNVGIQKMYPSLEDLTVNPTKEEQTFKSNNAYGYDNVVVEAIPDEYVKVNGTLEVTSNGEYDVREYEIVKTDIHEITPYKPRAITFQGYTGTELDYELANLDTSNLTSMGNLFINCSNITALDLSGFNTSNVTALSSTFMNCKNLTELNLNGIDTSKVAYITTMFSGCEKLTELDLSVIDTSNVISMNGAFTGCSKLTTLTGINASSCNMVPVMFSKCNNLTNFDGLKDLGKAYLTTSAANNYNYKLDLSACTNLTHDSLVSVINNLYDIASMGCKAQGLVLGTTNLNKLTADEIAVATNKGWNVS